MEFILQSKAGELDIDTRILKEELQRQKFMHQFICCELEKMEVSEQQGGNFPTLKEPEAAIPIGDLRFVSAFLNRFHGIKHMSPLEVPDILRTEEFLKRSYSIIEKKDVPKQGYYFTKYVSKLKVFSHTGMIETLQHVEPGKEPFLKEGLYQVSEVVDIIAEYRCFIHQDKLQAINYYDGVCTVFPDTKLLNKAILKYQLDPDRPEAYTMDIAVIKDRGTAILEVHPWVSVGLYGYVFGSNLPYCYRDGFRWYIEKNNSIQLFSNF